PRRASLEGAAAPRLGEEIIQPGEGEMIDALVKHFLDRIRAAAPPGTRPVTRNSHPKAHGLLRAEFIVMDDLPEVVRHGVFREPHTFDALIRFSTIGERIKSDIIPELQGMAIKLLGVEGDKVIPAERDAKTQDFLLVNYPVFAVRDLREYM